MTHVPIETPSYRYAERLIVELLRELKSQNVDARCANQAILAHAINFCEATLGSARTAELLTEMAAMSRENHVPAADQQGLHWTREPDRR
jgi:hypothetical protein